MMHPYSVPSGKKLAPAQVMTGPGALSGIDGIAPTSGVVVITLYDSDTSDITNKLVLAEVEVDAGMVSVNHEFNSPVNVNRGIYAAVSGSGSGYAYIVRYLRG